jgi:hypothetical protein
MWHLKPNAMQRRQELIKKEVDRTSLQNKLTPAALAAPPPSPI